MSSNSVIRLPLCAILLPNRDLSFQSVQTHRRLMEKRYLSEPPVDVSYNEEILDHSEENNNTLTNNSTNNPNTEDNDDNTCNIIEEEEMDNISEIIIDNVQSPTATTTTAPPSVGYSDDDSVSSQLIGVAIVSPRISPSNISSPSSPVSISQLSSSPSTPSMLSRKSSGNMKSGNNSKTNDELLLNLEMLRNKYLEYLFDNNVFKIPNVCGRYEMMLTFMDYVYDPIIRKPSLYIKDFNDLLRVMDAFCHSSLWIMGNDEELEWIKSEGEAQMLSTTKSLSTDSELPFLNYFVNKIIPMRNQGRAYRWFHHVRLGQFLVKIYTIYKNGQSYIFKTESSDEQSLSNNQSNGCNQVSLMDEVQLICDMFYTLLEDTFVAFQHKHFKFVKKWTEKGIKGNNLPRFLIECYKKKNEYNQEMQSSANKLTIDDLSMKHVIDRDWKFAKYLAKEYSSDWFLNYMDKGRVVQWASERDYSDGLQLRLTKNVGIFEYPIENVAKALNYDNHLDYTFSNLKYHTYSPIDASNSMKKYPSVLLNADLLLGPLFSTRSFNVICSSQAKFVGDELTETYILFRSCDMNSSNTSEKVKFPYIGLRVLTKLDNNKTRYVELRMGNAGGFVSAKKVVFNSLMAKKLTTENYNGLLNCIKRCEKTNFQPPKSSDNSIMRTFSEYCKKYCNIDLDKQWK